MKKNTIIISISIIVGCLILGGSLYMIQIYKQQIIEAQRADKAEKDKIFEDNITAQKRDMEFRDEAAKEEELRKAQELIANQKAELDKLNSAQAEKKQEAAILPVKNETTKNIGILCNGTYWLDCPSGQKFYCPPSGGASCTLISTISPQKECLTKGIMMLTEADNKRRESLDNSGITNINRKSEIQLQNMKLYGDELYFIQLTCGVLTKEDQVIHALEQISNSINNLAIK